MPRLAETDMRRPNPLVGRRACQGRLREHKGDSAETEDVVCAVRGTYGGGASAPEGDVGGAGWG